MSTMEPDEGNQADGPRWERVEGEDADPDDADPDDSTDS
jgi:hypothetical protein